MVLKWVGNERAWNGNKDESVLIYSIFFLKDFFTTFLKANLESLMKYPFFKGLQNQFMPSYFYRLFLYMMNHWKEFYLLESYKR